MLIVICLIDLGGRHDLREAVQRLIGHRERHIGENQDALRHKPFAAGAPDGFAVILLIQARDLVDKGQCLAAAEIAAVYVKVTGVAEVISLVAQISKGIQRTIPKQVQRVRDCAAHRWKQRHHDHHTGQKKQCPHDITSSATLCGQYRT